MHAAVSSVQSKILGCRPLCLIAFMARMQSQFMHPTIIFGQPACFEASNHEVYSSPQGCLPGVIAESYHQLAQYSDLLYTVTQRFTVAGIHSHS